MLNGRYFLFVVVFFIAGSSAIGQSPSIEALFEKYNEKLHDSVKLEIYRNLAIEYTSVDIPMKIKYSRKHKKLAEILNRPSDVIEAEIEIAMAYILTDDKDSAVFYLTKASESAKHLKLYELAGRAATNHGYIYERIDADNYAIEKYKEAINYFKKVDYYRGLGHTLTNIGSIYYDNGLYELAKDYFNQGLDYNIKSKDDGVIATSYFALASTYIKLGKNDLSRSYFDKSKKLHEKSNNLYGLALIKWGLSDLHFTEKKYTIAYQLSHEAYIYFKKMKNQHNIAIVLNTLANSALKIGKKKESVQYANELLELGILHDSKNFKANAYQLFSDISLSEKNFEKATEYLQLTSKYKDSLNLENKIENVLLSDLNRVKDDSKSLLMKQNEINNKNNEYYKIIIIILISLVVLIVMSLLLIKRINEAKLSNQLLQQQKDELAAAYEINVQINRQLDIHNKVKNNAMSILSHDVRTPLANLTVLLEMYRNKEFTHQGFNQVLLEIEDNIFETREFLDNILEWTKSQFDGVKIVGQNLSLHELFTKNLKLVDFQVVNKGLIIQNKIDPNHLVFADRNMIDVVVRNLLSNSIKFCKEEDYITLSSIENSDTIEFLISDTGRGMSSQKVSNLFKIENGTSYGTSGEVGYNLGLVLSKDMIDLNKGSIRVESTLGRGTTFFVILPKQKSV